LLERNAHLNSVRGRFSAAAQTYDAHAGVQRATAERLLALLLPERSFDRILEVGCGTGLLTEQLANRFPSASIHAMDLSERMIRAAESRCGHRQLVTWIAGDLLELCLRDRFQLVVSNCSLHWIERLAEGLVRAAGVMEPGSMFAASVMLRGTLGELRESRLRVAPHKAPLRDLPSESDVLGALAAAGLELRTAATDDLVVRHGDAGGLLRMIHEQGLTGGSFSRSRVPLTRQELTRLRADYDAHYADDQGVRSTYRVLYAVAASS
jgi:malonyl-CoA O-methyltransferase